MPNPSRFFALALLAVLGAAPAASAHDHGAAAGASVGVLTVSGAWVRATLPGQKTAGGYLAVENTGASSDRLIAAASPAAARVEIHSMTMNGDVMEMRPVDGGVDVPAGGSVELAPGGFHLMLIGVAAPLQAGESVPLTLTFEKAGAVRLDAPVLKAAPDPHAGHSG